MSEEKNVRMEEFSEVEVEEQRRGREWRRKSVVKAYPIADVDGGRIYENMQGDRRILVKVFANAAYVIEEEVKEDG